MMAMLRAEFIKAQEYMRKREKADPEKTPDRDLGLEMIGRVLKGEIPLMITANRAQDIAGTLRLAKEFNIRVWLDSASEGYLLIDEIKAAGVPVIVHPTMVRAFADFENMSFETAAKLHKAGIPVALQSGTRATCPRPRRARGRVGGGHGLTRALATITIDALKILGIDNRVGSLAVGKDGDVALRRRPFSTRRTASVWSSTATSSVKTSQ